MKDALIIVESPTKANTIHALFPQYESVATFNRLMELPKNEYALVVKDGCFEGKWQIDPTKRILIEQLRMKSGQYDKIFIACDASREGELIAEQVADIVLKGRPYFRIVFNELTKDAIETAMANARAINLNTTLAAKKGWLIESEIDRQMSEIIEYDFMRHNLQEKPKGIGTIISPALHLVANNQREIDEFVPEEYEQVVINYSKDGIAFDAIVKGRYMPEEKEEMDRMLYFVRTSEHRVVKYRQRTKDIQPYPPLTTARLTRAAFYLFGKTPKDTMLAATSLYEQGLITSINTTSVFISDRAIKEMVAYLNDTVPQELVVEERRKFKTKEGAVQGEAIRPTAFNESAHPDTLGIEDEYEKMLYEFIWYRTLSTQMTAAIYDTSWVEIDIGSKMTVKVEAYDCIKKGWEELRGNMMMEAEQEDEGAQRKHNVRIPSFLVDEWLMPLECGTVLRSTRAPGRYGVGRFVTVIEPFTPPVALERVVDTMEEMGYIKIVKGMINVLPLGLKVDSWTMKRADWLADPVNTSQIEFALKEIEAGESENPDEVLQVIDEEINALKKRIGFVPREYWPPSKSKESMARRLAIKMGKSDEEIREIVKYDRTCQAFIDANYVKKPEIGLCPECKARKRKGVVIDHGEFYGCSEFKSGCSFKLNKKRWQGKLEQLGHMTDEQEINRIVKAALTTNPVVIEDFVKRRNSEHYAARVKLEKDTKWGWGLKLSFVRNKNQEVA